MTTDSKISKVQELVYEIRVGDVMKKEVITVSPANTMGQLGVILRERRISGTPVVDRGKLVGIISMDDFIGWLIKRNEDCSVARNMTKDVQTLYPDEPLIHAVNRFERFGFGRFPVIDRDSRKLLGIITRGTIVAGLLKKLDIEHFEEEEVNRQRMKHLVGDIFADKVAFFFQYDVVGHDFNRAGETASRLKRTLKRLGVDSQVVRRAAIATYEAEMNLIIYTDGGRIRVRVEPKEILVRVEDSGPGIPDIEKALQPGYSTAPEWVRELGFGAGMGLDNIRKCASRMGLRSKVGKGTQLRIYVSTEDGEASETD